MFSVGKGRVHWEQMSEKKDAKTTTTFHEASRNHYSEQNVMCYHINQ